MSTIGAYYRVSDVVTFITFVLVIFALVVFIITVVY